MKKLIVLLNILWASSFVHALEVPPLTSYVNDTAGILSAKTKNDIQNFLAKVDKQTGIEIAFLSIPSLENESLEQYSIRVVDKWKLGKEDLDNGVLLLLAMAEKKVRIEVGYGLEGQLTDAKSSLIINSVIVPEFKKGNFDLGIAKGIGTIVQVASNGQTIQNSQNIPATALDQRRKRSGEFNLFPLIFILIYLLSGIGRYRRHRGSGRSWWLILPMMMMGSGRRTYGGFSGGGFSGGGFSGGGGGFGGGGASGGW